MAKFLKKKLDDKKENYEKILKKLEFYPDLLLTKTTKNFIQQNKIWTNRNSINKNRIVYQERVYSRLSSLRYNAIPNISLVNQNTVYPNAFIYKVVTILLNM